MYWTPNRDLEKHLQKIHRQTEEKNSLQGVVKKSSLLSHNQMSGNSQQKTCENRQNIIRYCTDTVLDLIVCTFLLPRAASWLTLGS